MVDPNQLDDGDLNLALNARDAMPGGGKLIPGDGRGLSRRGDAGCMTTFGPGTMS